MQPDDLAKVLRRAIREGVLKPGQPLVQDDLAKRFKVSRIPIREALRMLAADGLVTSRPGGGLAVMRLTAEQVSELYDLRVAIEPTLAPHIVANVNPATLERWHALVRDLDSESGDSRAWVQGNYRFHLALYETADRPLTLRTVHSLLDLTEPYSRLYMETTGVRGEANREHEEMLLAIERSQPDVLAKLIADHLKIVKVSLFDFLSDTENDPTLKALDLLA